MWFAFFPRRVGGIQGKGIGLLKKFPIPDALLLWYNPQGGAQPPSWSHPWAGEGVGRNQQGCGPRKAGTHSWALLKAPGTLPEPC